MEDRLKCQISPLVKYRRNQQTKIHIVSHIEIRQPLRLILHESDVHKTSSISVLCAQSRWS